LPESILVWVLPEVKTCPGRTVECELVCYAKNPVIQYGAHITDSRDWNFKISKSKHFAKMINSQIKGLRELPEAIRIHEAGDFYSQEYLDKWKLIAYQNPTITFFTYTRSWMLDFKERPKNLVVFYSTDSSTKHPAPDGVDNIAEMVDGELFADMDSKFCWRWNLNKPGSCRECNYCYDGKDEKKHVTFFKHR